MIKHRYCRFHFVWDALYREVVYNCRDGHCETGLTLHGFYRRVSMRLDYTLGPNCLRYH